MLAFEDEYTRLLKELWDLNKSVAHPDVRHQMAQSFTRRVPRFDFERPAEAAQAAAEVHRKGYQLLGECLSAQEVAAVKAQLEPCPLFDAEATNYQDSLVSKQEFPLAARPPQVHLARYKAEDVLRCVPLLRLACSPRIAAAAEAYVGCTPTISGFQVWHTFPGNAEVPAEEFHRDRDCFSFVKLFVYLSDVDEGAGPHEFIQFSHSASALEAHFRARGMHVDLPVLFQANARHLDRGDLRTLLGDSVVRTTGRAGSGFLEDTFGLHRGTRPSASPRLIFSVTYTCLPLRYANENDRTYEMGRRLSFDEAGFGGAGELERYLLRYFLR